VVIVLMNGSFVQFRKLISRVRPSLPAKGGRGKEVIRSVMHVEQNTTVHITISSASLTVHHGYH